MTSTLSQALGAIGKINTVIDFVRINDEIPTDRKKLIIQRAETIKDKLEEIANGRGGNVIVETGKGPFDIEIQIEGETDQQLIESGMKESLDTVNALIQEAAGDMGEIPQTALLGELEDVNVALTGALGAMQQQRDALRKKLRTAKQELQQARFKIRQLKGEQIRLNNLVDGQANLITKLRVNESELKTKLQNITDERDRLLDVIDEANDQIGKLQDAIVRNKSSIEVLKRKLEASNQSISDKQSEIDNLTTELQSLSSKLQTQEQLVEKLEDELAKLDAERASAVEAANQAVEVNASAEVREAAARAMQNAPDDTTRDAAVEKLAKTKQIVDTYLSTREGLRSQVNELVAEKDALVAERDALVAEKDALLAKVDELTAENTKLQQERDAAIASSNQQDSKVVELRKELETSTQLVAKLEEQLSETKTKLETTKANLSSAESEETSIRTEAAAIAESGKDVSDDFVAEQRRQIKALFDGVRVAASRDADFTGRPLREEVGETRAIDYKKALQEILDADNPRIYESFLKRQAAIRSRADVGDKTEDYIAAANQSLSEYRLKPSEDAWDIDVDELDEFMTGDVEDVEEALKSDSTIQAVESIDTTEDVSSGARNVTVPPSLVTPDVMAYLQKNPDLARQVLDILNPNPYSDMQQQEKIAYQQPIFTGGSESSPEVSGGYESQPITGAGPLAATTVVAGAGFIYYGLVGVLIFGLLLCIIYMARDIYENQWNADLNNERDYSIYLRRNAQYARRF